MDSNISLFSSFSISQQEQMTQTYRYPEGDVYEGDWSKEGKKHGIGKITFYDGSMYEGRFMNGFFSGYGTLRLADGTVYTGSVRTKLIW